MLQKTVAWVAACVALLGAARVLGAEATPAELGRVPWGRDYDAAVKQARENGKPLLLMFSEVPG